MRSALTLASLLIMGFMLSGLTSCSPNDASTATTTSPSEPADGNSTTSETATSEHPLADTVEVASDNASGSVKRSDSSEVTEITFEDIALPIDADMVFRPIMMTERAQSLDGERVRINGFMLADSRTRGIKEFILVKNTECKFGPGGQADHLVNVKVKIKNGVIHRTEAVSIEGVMTINPFTGFDGNTWSIFDMDCEHIEKYKPRR